MVELSDLVTLSWRERKGKRSPHEGRLRESCGFNSRLVHHFKGVASVKRTNLTGALQGVKTQRQRLTGNAVKIHNAGSTPALLSTTFGVKFVATPGQGVMLPLLGDNGHRGRG